MATFWGVNVNVHMPSSTASGDEISTREFPGSFVGVLNPEARLDAIEYMCMVPAWLVLPIAISLNCWVLVFRPEGWCNDKQVTTRCLSGRGRGKLRVTEGGWARHSAPWG